MKAHTMDPTLVIHPGEILKEEFLAPHGLSANRLAKALRIPTNRITEIINGGRRISGDTAILLGHAFGTTPEFWLNLQSRHDLDVARTKISPEAISAADAFARELTTA
jgi:addiction module HigA family antidote